MTYPPNGSNYHDHLCRCPGCSGDYSPEEQAMIEQEWKKKQAERRVDFIKRMVPTRETNAERLYRLSTNDAT